MACIPAREDLVVLRGTLKTFRRRCGKPTCHCANGEPHESPALFYRDGGQRVTVTLTAAEVPEVAAALQRYEVAQAELDERVATGIAALRARHARPSR